MQNITYGTTFKAEVKEENGKPVVLLTGSLMNDKMNSNHWEVPTAELESLAQQFAGQPIKLQHSDSDWDIIGTGVQATVVDTDISYVAKITDSKAVEKFISKTWTANNMGISPSVHPTVIECNICGKDLTKNAFACPHIVGEEYDKKIAGIITKDNKLMEASLTSRAAYEEVGSGNIDEVTMVASIQKITKTEEKIMAEKTELEAKVAELETLTAELKDSKAALKEAKEEIKKKTDEEEAKKKIEEEKKIEEKKKTNEEENVDEKKLKKENAELTKKLEATKKEVAEFKKTVREAELKVIISDETIVAEILEKEMTDDQFKAEVEMIKKIQVTPANGSALAESGSGSQGKDVFETEFGASKNDIVKRLMGAKE